MAAEFGATPWGRAWVRTVESTAVSAPNALLPRARGLARNHAVALSTETGRVVARVSASGAVHEVRIDLPPWSEETSAEARRLIAGSLAAHGGLAAGDLPDSLDADFRDRGIGHAVGLAEQTSTCDCRTRKRPCVHVLATVYALSLRIDERPALAVELRSDVVEVGPEPEPDWIALGDLDVAAFYG